MHRALLGRAPALQVIDDVPPLGDDQHLAAGEVVVAFESLRDLLAELVGATVTRG